MNAIQIKKTLVFGVSFYCCVISIVLLLVLLRCTDDLTAPDPDPDDPDSVLVLYAPFGLEAEALANYTMNLQWRDTSGYKPFFVIQRADSAYSFISIDTISNSVDTVTYADTSVKKAHGTYRYRLYSFFDTLISKYTDTVEAALPNNPPVMEITNYDTIVNSAFRVKDTVYFYFKVTDADTDAVVISASDSQVTIENDTGRFYLADTIADTLEFFCSDNFGGKDSMTVPINYIDTNYAPVFNHVTPPQYGIAGKRALCSYSVTDPDNDDVTMYVDSIIDPFDDPRDVTMYLEDTTFSFNLLPHDTGLTAFTFIVRDPFGESDTIVDTFLVIENSDMIFNTTGYDSISALVRYDINGSNGGYITPKTDSIGTSAVSPANDKVVYQKRFGAYNEIRTIDPKGTADNLLFVDSQKIYYPTSWSSGGNAIAFRMAVPDSGTWSIVTYTTGTTVFDTVYSGIPAQGKASGPVYSSNPGGFIFSNNDTLFSYSPAQGLAVLVINAIYPQVIQSSGALFFCSFENGPNGVLYKLIRSDITGQNSVIIADFGTSIPGYMALDQSKNLAYGLVKHSGFVYNNISVPAWLYFAEYNKLVDIDLVIETRQ